MSYYAYMLRCADGSYYTGHTEDIEARLFVHQQGILRGYTASRRPVELVWCEQFETRDEAFRAEFRIKGWRRSKKEALIAGDWRELVRLSHLRTDTSRSGGVETASLPGAAVAHPSSASG